MIVGYAPVSRCLGPAPVNINRVAGGWPPLERSGGLDVEPSGHFKWDAVGSKPPELAISAGWVGLMPGRGVGWGADSVNWWVIA